MKVAALGDAHLGRAYHNVTDPVTGVNQRERDFELSFEAAVDLALAQEPDLLVWLGDVFDHPSLTDPAPFALVVLRKLHALLERAKGRR